MSKETPWPIEPLVDSEEDLVWFGWIKDLKKRDWEEVLRSRRTGDDPSTRMIYELSGMEVLIYLWKNHMSTSLYISEKPLNELRKRYIRRFYDPKQPETCTQVLATKLRCSEQFVREALGSDEKEDPRQIDAFKKETI